MSFKNKSLYLGLIGAVLINLTACASENKTINVSSTSTEANAAQARIRLYGQNQKNTQMTYTQNQHKVRVNTGSMKDSFLSFIGSPKNQSLGIPATEMSTHMQEYNGILSKIYYQEYVIPTNTPITVNNAFQALPHELKTNTSRIIYSGFSCTGDKVTFTAEPGKDYEVIPSSNSANCGVAVLQIQADGSTNPVSAEQ